MSGQGVDLKKRKFGDTDIFEYERRMAKGYRNLAATFAHIKEMQGKPKIDYTKGENVQIGRFSFRRKGYSAKNICKQCGSRWPAYTTVEAHTNWERAHVRHPGERCQLNP